MLLNNAKRNTAALFAIFFGVAFQAEAAQPSGISYCARGKTKDGAKYSTYTVRCSNGKKREITAWNKNRKWCVGTSEKKCAKDQLKAAKMACTGQ